MGKTAKKTGARDRWRIVKSENIGPLVPANDPLSVNVSAEVASRNVSEVYCVWGRSRPEVNASVWLTNAAICAKVEFESLAAFMDYMNGI